MGLGHATAVHGGRVVFKREFDFDLGQLNGMTQGDQLGSLLGRHNAGHACHRQHIAFLVGALCDLREGLGLHQDAAARDRASVRGVLVTDIDHARMTLLVEMGQLGHGLSPRCAE